VAVRADRGKATWVQYAAPAWSPGRCCARVLSILRLRVALPLVDANGGGTTPVFYVRLGSSF